MSDEKEVRVRISVPQTIEPESWLNDPRFEWFRKGHEYAQTQTRAIPALAKVSPEELYFAVSAILRSAGKEPKDSV